MTIQERIQAIAKEMDIAYIYHNWTSVNQMADTAQLPVMINVLPVSGQFQVDGFRLTESANCLVAFLDKTDYDFDAEENDTIVERMKGYAKRFLLAVNATEGLEPLDLSTVDYQIVYDKLDVNLTGVMLDLRIKESEGICVV